MLNLMDFEIIEKADFDSMTFDSGVIVKNLDMTNFTLPGEGDILLVTSGNITVNDNVTRLDLGDDVNGIHFAYAELQVVTGKDASTITVTSLKFGTEDIKRALGAADVDTVDERKVTTRLYYKDADFENLGFIMHRVDGGYVVLIMPKALSTGGLAITTQKGGKGTQNLTFTGFRSINAKTTAELEYYVVAGSQSGIDISAQPANVTVEAGTATSFSVTATGATGYQWQVQTPTDVGFVNISGETTATLSLLTTDVTEEANGNRYRCKLTNASGARYTIPAVLTVTDEA